MKIAKVILFICFGISFTNANPVLVTFINEFQTASDFGQAIELHPSHSIGTTNISGWTIKTQAGTATIPSCIIQSNGYEIIDTFSITGIFYMNPVADSLRLYNNYGVLQERIVWGYPGSKTPAPPYNGSTCIYRSNPSMYWDLFSYYIDSTPTLGGLNNNWSSISGTVFNAQGQPINGYCVIAEGKYGSSCVITNSNGYFNICGLAQSKYWVTVWSNYNTLAGQYPDSVYVGYSQNVSGINITVPLSNIEEKIKIQNTDFSFSISNPVRNKSNLNLILPYETEVLLKLYDVRGVLLRTVLEQKLSAGQHQIRLHLNPGLYFLDADISKQRFTRKIIVVE
jgi:hypothetical protein